MSNELTPRAFDMEVDADFDFVWRALTTAEGLASWYAVEAGIEPVAGGVMTIDFGTGPIAMGTISDIEPGRRLRLVYGGDGAPGVEEWLIEGNEAVTRLRLVHSLPVADGDTWDGTYPGIVRGWSLFMGTLRFVAGRVRRLGRESEVRIGDVAADAWGRVLEALGLSVTPAPGESVALGVAEADVLVSVDDYSLLLAVDDRATLLLDVEGDNLYTVAATYGTETPEAASLRAALTEIAERACAAASARPAAAS
jgi:uncharacterized protein YndB with AHSA1/START domain